MRKTFRKIRLIDVIIAEVHRTPWVRGPGESWMELIPAVEFPNFDIDEYDEYAIFLKLVKSASSIFAEKVSNQY